MIDFVLCQGYKVSVKVSPEMAEQGRGRHCLKTPPMAHDQSQMARASLVWCPGILPVSDGITTFIRHSGGWTMKDVVFAMELRGRAAPVEGSTNTLSARTGGRGPHGETVVFDRKWC